MTMTGMLRAVAAATVVFGLAAATAAADECGSMSTAAKRLIDQLDPAAKGGNNSAKLCAAFGEGLGVIRSFRIIIDECMDEGDKRTEVLAGLDRSIRQLQGSLDSNCQ
jgi:hypothetical protein